MQPQVHSVTPILPVEDIAATITYYRDILGASDSWIWGEPPNHAGCLLGSVWIQFTLEPDLCRQLKGISMFLNVLQIEALHGLHVDAGATIVSPLEAKPWGVREYTVKDFNGVLLRFAQNGFLSDRREPRDDVSVVARRLTTNELRDLMVAVNWTFDDNEESLSKSVNDPIFTVVIEHDGNCVGTGAILGHESGNYLIFNVIVHPNFQSQGIGKRIMGALDSWLTTNGIPGAMVKLFTGLDRQPFYQQFGFRGPEHGLVGMTKALGK